MKNNLKFKILFYLRKKLINTSRFGNNTAALYSPNSVEQEKDNKSPDIKEAEKQIQNFIILRAWRNGREKNKKLETEIKNLSNQVSIKFINLF